MHPCCATQADDDMFNSAATIAMVYLLLLLIVECSLSNNAAAPAIFGALLAMEDEDEREDMSLSFPRPPHLRSYLGQASKSGEGGREKENEGQRHFRMEF